MSILEIARLSNVVRCLELARLVIDAYLIQIFWESKVVERLKEVPVVNNTTKAVSLESPSHVESRNS